MTLIEQLKTFIEGSDQNAWGFDRKWIEGDQMKVYVRVGQRYLPSRDFRPDKQKARTLEIASIEVAESEQGKGHFAEFLAEAEKINPCEALYIENVLTQRFESFFVRSGFLPVPDTFPACFYKWRPDV